MKKVLLLCLCLFFPCALNAECDYKTEKNMTSLSIYVDYDYTYNEETEKFDVTVYNLQNIFAFYYGGNTYSPNTDKKAYIFNIEPGTNMELEVFGTGVSLCSGKSFRKIKINIPYINPYYNSEECEGYSNTTVCYSRFLNFRISQVTFKNALHREEEKIDSEKENKFDIFLNILNFIKKYYVKIVIITVTTVLSVLIYKNKYRKSKHGF